MLRSPLAPPLRFSLTHRAVATAREYRFSSRVGEGAALDVVGVSQKAADERLGRGRIPHLFNKSYV